MWAKKPTVCARHAPGGHNPTSGLAAYRDAPQVLETRDRIEELGARAASNLVELLR